MTDDQGYGDFGVTGNDIIETPAMNRLAAESVSFDRFYVSPVCAPARAALLTGRYYLRTGVTGVTGGEETMNDEKVTIAEILKANGYTTCFGKWHNGANYPYDAGIYAMCESVDQNVEKLLDKVSALNLDEKTIILFLTDNGPNGYRLTVDRKGKRSLYDMIADPSQLSDIALKYPEKTGELFQNTFVQN